jgi:serine-type D-Ala-D-Ala carboxypeptidase (penicillin-binding protein 5/6)
VLVKKYYIGIGIVTLAIISLLAFLIIQKEAPTNTKKLLGVTSTAPTEKGPTAKEIKKNADKYQPKDSQKTATSGLDLSAKSAILVDENTGRVLYEKSPHMVLPPASITKVATIAVALENLKKDQLITISQTAADREPNKIVMKAGEKLKAEDLFNGLMMISANDAAWAIAEAVPGGYPKFIALMNQKAKSLGLKDTNFVNPAGLDDEKHLTTAFDIATFVRYDLINHPEFVAYAGNKSDYSVLPTDHNESHWWSHISHMLYAYPGMIAAKTGYTDIAKSTFVGVADRNGRKITVVFMGATDANGDVTKLLDYGFSKQP